MFGLVRAYKPEMKFKEYETYKAIYCTLCKRIGKKYGVLSRMTLSYDVVFMIMLGMSVEETKPCYEVKRCTSNPLKKCTYCKGEEPIIDYCSAVMLLLAAAKIKDNITDSKFPKSLMWRVVNLFYNNGIKKAEKEYPQIAQICNKYIMEQTAVEKKETDSIDAAAEPTAKALQRLFEGMTEENTNKRIFGHIGYLLGKWIYIGDSVLDYSKDKKSNSFNPFLQTENINEIKTRADGILNSCELAIANDFALLDVKKFKPILENIIYFGFDEVKRNIFKEIK